MASDARDQRREMMRSLDRMNKRHKTTRSNAPLAVVPDPAPAPAMAPVVDEARDDAVRRVAGQLWWHAQAAPTVEDAAQVLIARKRLLSSNGMAPE